MLDGYVCIKSSLLCVAIIDARVVAQTYLIWLRVVSNSVVAFFIRWLFQTSATVTDTSKMIDNIRRSPRVVTIPRELYFNCDAELPESVNY